jgi:hypothetical protein
MAIKYRIAGLTLALSLLAGQAPAQEGATRIPRSQIAAMFADMKAHAPWNMEGDLLWGYYFTGTDKSVLEKAAKDLVGQGYRLAEIRLLDQANNAGVGTYQLHVERVEHHTPDSLFARNSQLYDFAASHGLATYDGMDVGPVR